ncbi:MAG: FadR family transcriptional regulator [Gammaproteobacteria bacterium]|nr:FadR family transcriptional regulator [Gammaproteobacteria bacterium]
MPRTQLKPPPHASTSAISIANELRNQIIDGYYADQERLPAERELVERFTSSRGTIRSALRRLEQDNLIVRRIGSGTYVSHRDHYSQADIAAITSPLEVIEVRIGIEPHMTRLAVANAKRVDLERLSKALRSVENCGCDRDRFTHADAEFHSALAHCTHNALLQWMYARLNDVRNHSQWKSMKDKVLTQKRIKNYNRQHRQLYEAIASRDVDAGVSTINLHLERARDHLLGK